MLLELRLFAQATLPKALSMGVAGMIHAGQLRLTTQLCALAVIQALGSASTTNLLDHLFFNHTFFRNRDTKKQWDDKTRYDIARYACGQLASIFITKFVFDRLLKRGYIGGSSLDKKTLFTLVAGSTLITLCAQGVLDEMGRYFQFQREVLRKWWINNLY